MTGEDQEPRWQQRFRNFEKALAQLNTAVAMETYTPLELAGLVKTFEFTFELAWKTLGDILKAEGLDAKTPREILRQSLQKLALAHGDVAALLEALDERNVLSHTYDEKNAAKAKKLIPERFAPALNSLHSVLAKRTT